MSKTHGEWFGVGLTLVDALDTMYILGLKDGKVGVQVYWYRVQLHWYRVRVQLLWYRVQLLWDWVQLHSTRWNQIQEFLFS